MTDGAAVAAAACTAASLTTSVVSLIYSVRALRMAVRTRRTLDEIGESTVRSVMEESGGPAGPLMETFERLTRNGVLANEAIQIAREIHGR